MVNTISRYRNIKVDIVSGWPMAAITWDERVETGTFQTKVVPRKVQVQLGPLLDGFVETESIGLPAEVALKAVALANKHEHPTSLTGPMRAKLDALLESMSGQLRAGNRDGSWMAMSAWVNRLTEVIHFNGQVPEAISGVSSKDIAMEAVQKDVEVYGTGYARHHPNGAWERIPPEQIFVSRSSLPVQPYGPFLHQLSLYLNIENMSEPDFHNLLERAFQLIGRDKLRFNVFEVGKQIKEGP